jgi:coenzyme F420-reducing hydrogenase delta subunit
MNNKNEQSNGVPRIAVLYCQNCLVKDADITSAMQKVNGFSVNPSMQPCSSKVQLSHVLKVLDQEADGVQVVACPEKSCRFLIGSSRAENRIAFGRQMLDRIQMGAERLGIIHKSGLSGEDLIDLAAQRAEMVKEYL